MAKFTYTAEKPGGEIYRGIAEAPDRFELYRAIRREGGRLLSLEEDARAKGFFSLARWNKIFSAVPEQEKILFSRNLGSMLQAGLPLSRALSVIERETKNPRLKDAASEIAGAIRRGETLHASFERFPALFSPLAIAMVRAGEEGGDLPVSLQLVSDQMERVYLLKKKVRGALIYPCIILVAIAGIGALMMIEVVPTLAQTFKEMSAQLPLSTRTVIALSDFLTHDTLFAFGSLVLALAFVFWAARTARGKRGFEFVFLHTPVIGGIVREINAARTSRTLSSLLSAGVGVIPALEIAGEVVQNTHFRDVILEAARGVGEGETLSAAFMRHEDLYPALVGEMTAVGEETGRVAEMLKRLAVFYEDEVDRATKDLSTIVEPLLMIVVGAAVGYFAVAMIAPIYSLSQNM